MLGDEANERDIALGELERLRRLAHEAALATGRAEAAERAVGMLEV